MGAKQVRPAMAPAVPCRGPDMKKVKRVNMHNVNVADGVVKRLRQGPRRRQCARTTLGKNVNCHTVSVLGCSQGQAVLRVGIAIRGANGHVMTAPRDGIGHVANCLGWSPSSASE